MNVCGMQAFVYDIMTTLWQLGEMEREGHAARDHLVLLINVLSKVNSSFDETYLNLRRVLQCIFTSCRFLLTSEYEYMHAYNSRINFTYFSTRIASDQT